MKSALKSRAKRRAHWLLSLPDNLGWFGHRQNLYLVLFTLLSLAFALFSTLFYRQYTAIQDINDNAIRQYEIIRYNRRLMLDLVDMETGVRGFLLTGKEAHVEPYIRASERLASDITILHRIYESEPHQEVAEWAADIRQIQLLFDAHIFQKRRGRARNLDAMLAEQKKLMDDMRVKLEHAANQRFNTIQAEVRASRSGKQQIVLTIVAANIAFVTILLIGTVTIIRLENSYQTALSAQVQSEQQYRTVLNGINDGLFEYNVLNGNYAASPTWLSLLGYSEDEFEPHIETVLSLVHPEDVELMRSQKDDYIRGKTDVYTSTFRMRHKDGSYRWVLSRGIGIHNGPSGMIKTLIGTHADITPQKAREEELRQLNSDLETFTYITSHDLRSPLVNLKGFSHELTVALEDVRQVLLSDKTQMDEGERQRLMVTLNDDIPEALGYIGHSVDRMDALTRAILDLSRIGKHVYRATEVDMKVVTDKCIGAQNFEISQKGATILCDDLPVIYTDALAIEQVVGNLLDNAVKYLRPEVPGRIVITCHEAGSDYIFSIADNGRGIDKADQKKIFEIFRRARNTADVRGLGLGMAYVKATLRQLGGEIWFSSQLNEGTTFTFRLPKSPPPALIRPQEETTA